MTSKPIPLLQCSVLPPEEASAAAVIEQYPVTILQIGEGNFLRGFVDWMVQQCIKSGLYRGSVAVTQPRPGGRKKLEELREQDGIYTLMTRGIRHGTAVEEREVISVISRLIDPYCEWNSFMELAESPDLSIVISNTTEAGLNYERSEWNPSEPVLSFPGKLTVFLYRRFQVFGGDPNKGLMLLPCELVESNGDKLKSIVLSHAADWGLDESFCRWVREHNLFLNSLVDRIVTGYPEEAEEWFERWGYKDRLLNTTEPYYFWAIQGDASLDTKFPLNQAGLNVHWVEDLRPYQLRKVRILNGTHTLLASIGLLHGLDYVREAVEHPLWGSRFRQAIMNELVPSVPLSHEAMCIYAEEVWERFLNPFIQHRLSDISLNAVSKFKVRLFPSLSSYTSIYGELPSMVTESLASLIRLYKVTEREGEWYGTRLDGSPLLIRDDAEVLSIFRDNWSLVQKEQLDIHGLALEILSNTRLWGEDMSLIPRLTETVSTYLNEMELSTR